MEVLGGWLQPKLAATLQALDIEMNHLGQFIVTSSDRLVVFVDRLDDSSFDSSQSRLLGVVMVS
jgi:hypothetical protein